MEIIYVTFVTLSESTFWCKNANSTMMAADNIYVISVFFVGSRPQNDGVALHPKLIGFNFIEVSMNL